MNDLKHLLLSLSVLLLLPLQAIATDEELLAAGELLTQCEENATPALPNQYCMRYVFGLVQTTVTLAQSSGERLPFCIDPQQHRLETVTNKVIAYLRLQSGRLANPAQVLVLEALQRHYPCQLSGGAT